MLDIDINPHWDIDKERIIGNAKKSFNRLPDTIGVGLENLWWKVEKDNKIIAYAWVDISYDETEISICVDKDYRNKGLGKDMIDELEQIILRNNYPKRIVALIKFNNDYKNRLMSLLQQRGYKLEYPLYDAAKIGTITLFKFIE